MLYTIGPITGWFFYSKQSVCILTEARTKPFCMLYVNFCSKDETVCRALKQMYASSCCFWEQPRERLFYFSLRPSVLFASGN